MIANFDSEDIYYEEEDAVEKYEKEKQEAYRFKEKKKLASIKRRKDRHRNRRPWGKEIEEM